MISTITHNFSIAVISRVFVSVLGIFIVGILTRALGVDGFGQYSTVMAYLLIFSILADMGLHTILVREISQKSDSEVGIVSKLFTLRLILVLLVVILGIVVVWFLPYQDIIKKGVLVASGFIVLSSLVQILLGVFQKYLKIYFVSLADILMRIVQLVLLFLLVSIDQVGLISFLVVVVIAEAVHFIVVFLFARRIIPFSLSVDTGYWKKILRASLPIAVSLVFTLLYFRLDTIFLSLMRSEAEVGIYAVAYKILELVIFLPAVYIGLIMPLLSKFALTSKEKFRDVFTRAFDLLSVMAMPVAVYIFFYAQSITVLIGGDAFFASGDVLRILSVAIVMIFFGNLGGHSLIALDMQKKGMWIYLSGAVFNIMTNAIFIPRYGISAAAWTTVFTEIIVTISMFVVISRSQDKEMISRRTLKALMSALGLVAILIPVSGNFILGTVLLLTYIPLLLLFRVVSIAEIREMISLNTS